MATEKQRSEKLDKNIAKGGAELSGILKKSKRTVAGTVAEYTSLQRFVKSKKTQSALYADLANEYKKLNSDISEWTVKNVNKTSKDFWKYAKEDIPESAQDKAALKTFGAFSQKYANDIIGRINPTAVDKSVAINAQIGGMLTEDIRALRSAVSTTVAEGAVEGLTNPQLAARMQEKIAGKVGQFQFIDKAGRRWKAENYFGMLNRTLHATAARDSYIDAATKEAGFDLYQIEGGVTGSSADNPNDPCDNWAGRIISMTGNTKGYPTYQDAVNAGVFHPMCVHFIRAIMPSEIPEAKKEQAEERKEARELEEK